MPLAAASPLLRRLAATSEDRTFHGLLDPGAEVGGLDAIRIFESVHRQLARQRAAALFVDDLQWVDPLSLALCHFLVRATAGSGRGLALVVASRPSPVTDRFAASLATVIGDESPVVTLHIRPLDRDDGVRLVSSRAGMGAAEASALWERAGGSPFWLDLLAGAEGDGRDVDAVVAARTRGLGADANLLLGTLAILGRPVDALELEGLVGWPADRSDRATADLVERGLAIDDGGTTRLAHDLIRDVVVSRIPASTRRELEGRIADVARGTRRRRGDRHAGGARASRRRRVVRRRPRAPDPPRAAAPADRVRRRRPGGRARPRRRRPERPRPRRRGGGLARRRAGRPGPGPRAVVEGRGRHDRSSAGGPSRPRRRVRRVRPRARRRGTPLARRGSGGRRRDPRAADRRGRARGQDPPVAGAADGRGAADRDARRGAGPAGDRRHGSGRIPAAGPAHGLRRRPDRGLGGGDPGRGRRRDRVARRRIARGVARPGPPRGPGRAGDGRDGPRVRGDPAGRRRHVPPGLGRGVAGRPADRGDRRRLSPRLRAGRRPGAGRRAPHRRGGRAARRPGGRPRPRPRPDPAGEVPGRDGDVGLAGGRRGRSWRRPRTSPIRTTASSTTSSRRCGWPGSASTRTRRSATRRPHGRSWPPPDAPAAAGTWSCRPPRCTSGSIDGRRASRRSPAGTRRGGARMSRPSGCDAGSMRCSRSATGTWPARPRSRWPGCATRPKATAWPSTRCGRTSTSADASHRPTRRAPRPPTAGSPSAPT